MLFVNATNRLLIDYGLIGCLLLSVTFVLVLLILFLIIKKIILFCNKQLCRFSWISRFQKNIKSLFKGFRHQLKTRWWPRFCYFITDWVLTTNHRKLAILYFAFLGVTGFTGLVLATLIRLELAYPGQQLIANNAERYLTLVSIHGVVMVFFFVIPALFGAFGNYLIPLQLGIRDVAFPRLNSFMFWLTPGGFTLLLHLILFDRSHNVTYWVNYAATRAQLRRRYSTVENAEQRIHERSAPSVMAWRLAGDPLLVREARNIVLSESAPSLRARLSVTTNTANFHNSLNDAILACRFFISSIYNFNFSNYVQQQLYINYYSIASILAIINYIKIIMINNYLYIVNSNYLNYLPTNSIDVNYTTTNYTNLLFTQVWLTTNNQTSRNIVNTYNTFNYNLRSLGNTSNKRLMPFTGWSTVSAITLSPIGQQASTIIEFNNLGKEGLSTSYLNNIKWQLYKSTTLIKWPLSVYNNLYTFNSHVISLLPLFGTFSWVYSIVDKTAYADTTSTQSAVKLVFNNVLPNAITQLIHSLLNICDFNTKFNRLNILFNLIKGWNHLWIILYNSIIIEFFFKLKFTIKLFQLIDNLFFMYYIILNDLFNTILINKQIMLFSYLFNGLIFDYLRNYVFNNNVSNFKISINYTAIYNLITNSLCIISDLKFTDYGYLDKHYLSLNYSILHKQFNRLNAYLFITTCNRDHTLELSNFNSFGYSIGTALRCAFNNMYNLKGAVSISINSASGIKSHSATQSLSIITSQVWVAYDYLNDWRELRLEREVWRNTDALSLGRKALTSRTHYYANFFSPARLSTKLSTWDSARLIPGWAFITPFASRLRYTAIGKVDIALVVVFIATLGSVFSAVNYVITYRYIGAPLFKGRRELRPFFVDALLVASRMMLVANPALLIGIVLLLSDRHFNTSVFDFSGGGDTILFQHLFWFFGHPEVYIIVIPCFGFVNALLPVYLRKRLSGRLSLQFSMYTIALMSFAVWGHHMYMVGLANSVRTLYSTVTVMISVPASTKVLHWCVTLIQATFIWDVGFLFLLNFIYFFVLGGLSGMMVAHIGFDTLAHDTVYVIAHFHTILSGGVVSCIFGAFYFYFASIFNIKYSRTFAYAHYCFYTIGQLVTLVPMFWLGYAGMPRRVFDYPTVYAGWHSLISAGHLLTVLGMLFFALMLIDSFSEGRLARNRTLGVGRLNTCLAFAAYEIRKLQLYQNAALRLPAPNLNRAELYKFCATLESRNLTYVFSKIK